MLHHLRGVSFLCPSPRPRPCRNISRKSSPKVSSVHPRLLHLLGFFRPEKDGGLRPCIDYRALNERTVKFRYPLPLVPAALEQLRKARFYTKLDLRSAYNLVRIREGDEWKTAFSTCTGHYEYLVMPFGLSISPAVFQSFINDVFRDMLNRQVVVYIDDILIYSDTLEDHVQHVRAVLQRLIQYQLFAKIEKCDFHQTSISFLGYIISPGGVAMDEGKVKAVVEWPRPTTLKELQRFLGFANFYRRFIRGFSMVAEPLTALVRKGTSCLPWNEEATKAFSRLKQAFTSAPILHHPDPELPFVVEVDASSTGLGAVLSQRQGSPPKLYPCAYYSKKLSSAERNYDVGDRELLAMKAAFEEWRHWLEGSTHPFLVLTDHKNLEYLRTAKRLNPRQARWSLFFSRFQFTITFRPGSKNTKADSLSRQFDSETSIKNPETILSPDLVIGPIQWDIETELELANAHTGIHPACPPGKLYVPETLREKVLKHVHALPSSGHPGITATIHLLQNRFWWSTLSQDVSRFVSSAKPAIFRNRPVSCPPVCFNHCPYHNDPGHISPSILLRICHHQTDTLLSSRSSTASPRPAVSYPSVNFPRLYRPLNTFVIWCFGFMVYPKTSFQTEVLSSRPMSGLPSSKCSKST